MRKGKVWKVPPKKSSRSGDASPEHGVPAARKLPIVRKGFGEAHGEGRTQGGSHPHQEGAMGVACEPRGGEEGSECGDGPVHEPKEARLDHLEDEPVFVFGQGAGVHDLRSSWARTYCE